MPILGYCILHWGKLNPPLGHLLCPLLHWSLAMVTVGLVKGVYMDPLVNGALILAHEGKPDRMHQVMDVSSSVSTGHVTPLVDSHKALTI
ncbi:hypothetical protein CsSME_00002602 [Camellia sinensis var. sinensis]